MKIVFYVSAHGFGHAVRTSEVMRAILARLPEVEIHLRSRAPSWLFPAEVRGRISEITLDVGVVQQNSLTLDTAATLARMEEILSNSEALLRTEVDLLRDTHCDVVVGDIPPLAFEAARRAGVPSVAITNFSWDWIYRAYLPSEPRFAPIIDGMTNHYGAATLLLRLPFHGDLSAFPRHRDIPLITRRSEGSRDAQRRLLGLGGGPIALVSFGGFGLSRLPLARIARERPDWTFLLPGSYGGSGPRNIVSFDERLVRHENLVAAADVVMTKPGYGIVAECLANGARILYTSRGDFPEYPILEAAVRRHAHARYVSPEALLAGRIGDDLDLLLADESPVDALGDEDFLGAPVAANIILEMAKG